MQNLGKMLNMAAMFTNAQKFSPESVVRFSQNLVCSVWFKVDLKVSKINKMYIYK